MAYLLLYSGLVAALTASFLIVLPTLFVGIKYSSEPISFVVRTAVAGRIFKLGLVGTALLLICYISFLIIRYQVGIIPVSAVVYSAGSLCMIFVACIDIDFNERVHTLFTKGYFLLSTVGAVSFSCYVSNSFSAPLLISLIGGIGTVFLYFKLGVKAYSEYWGIVFAILWVLSFYYV